MLRITKLTDYAVVILSEIAKPSPSSHTARDVADRTRIPQPTVSKVLKHLARGRVVTSERGAKGGYRLARDPEKICLTDIIDAVEGPIAVTECSTDGASCEFEGHCPVEANWIRINDVVRRALSRITLAEMRRTDLQLVTLRLPTSSGAVARSS